MEKRKRTRIPAHFKASVWIGTKEIRTETQNISLTGILCDPDPRLHQGENCRVVMTLNKAVRITLEGRILRASPEETVISFLSMDTESFFHLKKILQFNAEDADMIEEELVNPAFK
ncbi:MAG: PilZ domain-containing protein [Syntrophales bacterium]